MRQCLCALTLVAAAACLLIGAPRADAAVTFERAWGNSDPLENPNGTGTDSAGNVYVADDARQRIVKYSPSGAVLERFDGGSGGTYPGITPSDVAVDASGNMYVADGIRVVKLNPDGDFIQEWGQYGGAVDTENFIFAAASIAIDSAGKVYVSDCATPRHRIQKFEPDGTFILEWGERGSGNAEFQCAIGLAIDSADNVYAADNGNNRVQKFDGDGTLLAKWGQAGDTDGRFSGPSGVAVDAADNVYVTDTFNHRVQKFTSAGAFLGKWGVEGDALGEFSHPADIAAFGSNLYVVDRNNRRVQKFNTSGAFLTSWGGVSSANGKFNTPIGAATDSAGNVYVTDQLNDRVQKFNASGEFLDKWGASGTGNGQLDKPTGIAVDGGGNVYVVDSGNSRVQKFTSDGAFLDKWGVAGAGPGEFQFLDPAFEFIHGIATDSAGDVYVADASRIQKFDSSGGFITEWGTFGFADGEFSGAYGVAVDSEDNIYVTSGCNRCDVQKFDSDGTFLTKWGTEGGADGQFRNPQGIAVTPDDEVVVVDQDNSRIQKFDSEGTFIESWGTNGVGDGQFRRPVAVATGLGDEVYVTDSDLHRVQKFNVDDSVAPPPAPTDLEVDPASPNTTLTPRIKGLAESGTQVKIYANATCTGAPVAQGSASSFSGLGIQVTVASGSTTTFHATATNLLADPAVTSACSTSSVSYQHVLPPAAPTGLSVSPSSPNSSLTPVISGTAPAGTLIEIHDTADCSGFAVAQGPAASFASPGIEVSVAENSTTTFRAVAVDEVNGLRSGCSTGSVTYVHQPPAPPAAPTGLSVSPSSPSSALFPKVRGSAPAGTTVEIYDSIGCRGFPIAADSAAEFAGDGIEVQVEPESTTQFQAIAVDDFTGLSSACSPSSVTYVHTDDDGGGGSDGAALKGLQIQGKKKIKPGKKVQLTLSVENSGGETATDVRIDLASSNNKLKVKPSITIDRIPAGDAASVTVPVKAKRTAKGKGTITATVSDLVANAKLKVKRPR